MKKFLGTLVLGLSFQTLVSANENVITLDGESFDQSIKDNPLVIVNFCAPGTAGCEALYREIEKAADILKEKSPIWANVDCLKEVDLCKRFDAISFPAIRVFEGPEKATRYREARKAEFLASLALKRSTPTVWEFDRGPEVEEFKKMNAITLIFRTNPSDDKAIAEFKKIAEAAQGSLSFAIERDPSYPKKGLVGPEITMYKSFGWEELHYTTGTMSKNQVLKFVQQQWKPRMPDLNQQNYPKLMETGKPIAYLFANTRIERDYYRLILNHLPYKWMHKIHFVVMDAWEWYGHAQELGLDTFPAFLIHNTPTKENFKFDTKRRNLTVGEVDKFVDEYVAEMIKREQNKPSKVEHNEL